MAKFIVQHRRGTAADWERMGDTIIPLEGELVLEIDESEKHLHRLKIGDGETAYNSLPYISVDSFILSQTARTVTISLFASNWWEEEDGDRHFQTVSISDITPRSKVDLQPSPEQLAIFHEKDIAFTTENDDGIVKVYVVGDKPSNDYEIQATVTEVYVDE